MGTGYYTLRVRMSAKSETAFGFSAQCDEDAVGQVLGVLKKLDAFCDRPRFEVVRADGTILRGIARHEQPG